MTENDIYRLVREIIRQEIAPIAMASIVSNADQMRTTFQRTASDSQFSNARNILPYGISARAPSGTDALSVPIGGNATHVNVVGHFDENRPSVNDGEVMIYNEFGQAVYLKNGSVHLGTPAGSHPVNLGDIVKSVLSQFLALYANHTHIGNLGYETAPPDNASDATALKSSPVDDGGVLSEIVFTG